MNLIPRADWGARRPKNRVTAQLTGPSTGHWNGPGIPDVDHSRCASLVRGIQNFHMDGRGWSDIAYNFIICNHGYVFEGRGFNVVNGANGTNAGNRSSHAVMWMDGKGNNFSDAEKAAFREAVRYIADNTMAPDQCIGHRDHKSTECPGDERYNWIRQGMDVSGGIAPTPAPAPSPGAQQPVLKLGSRGDSVRQVQTIILRRAGGDISVDGIFGPNTEKRVKDVQSFFGITPDGIVGPKTWEVLIFLASAQAAPTPAPAAPPPPPVPAWAGQPKSVIRRGSKGELVTYLQSIISTKAGGDISIDGDFGPGTERRVKDLQRFFGMREDGIVGPQTWAVIDSLAHS